MRKTLLVMIIAGTLFLAACGEKKLEDGNYQYVFGDYQGTCYAEIGELRDITEDVYGTMTGLFYVRPHYAIKHSSNDMRTYCGDGWRLLYVKKSALRDK